MNYAEIYAALEQDKKIPKAIARYNRFIAAAAVEQAARVGFSALWLARCIVAVISRETGGRNILGDGGHGRGLMQIDDRYHGEWLLGHQGGMEPESNIHKGAEILADGLMALCAYGVRAGIAAYNAGVGGVRRSLKESNGADPDLHTTGHNYGKDVLERMAKYTEATGPL